jgi:hypothetical protein
MPEDSWLNARHVWLVAVTLACAAVPTANAQASVCFVSTYRSLDSTYILEQPAAAKVCIDGNLDYGECCFSQSPGPTFDSFSDLGIGSPGNAVPGLLTCPDGLSQNVTINRLTKTQGAVTEVRK